MMTDQKIVHVAINPPESIESNLVKGVAAILNREIYEVRLLLSGRIPKLVAHFDNPETASTTAASLASLGQFAFMVDDVELRVPINSEAGFKADSLQLGDGKIKFLAKNGTEKIITADELFLILYGKMNMPITTTDKNIKMKINVPATLVAGGIPIWHKSEENVEKLSYQTEYFVRFYGPVLPEPIIEVFESGFNYAFLGSKISLSSSENLKQLVLELKTKFPNAIIDNRLIEGAPILQGSETENACKLIFLYHRARSKYTKH
jgi:hypothetical protein